MLYFATQRQQRNLEIPLKNLMLKIYEHNYVGLTQKQKKLIIDYMMEWFSGKNNLIRRIQFQNGSIELRIQQTQINENQSFCRLCGQEIFIYFAQRKSNTATICLKCVYDRYVKLQQLEFNQRYNSQSFRGFLADNQKKYNCLLYYCSGRHIGKVCRNSLSILKLLQNQQKKVKQESQEQNKQHSSKQQCIYEVIEKRWRKMKQQSIQKEVRQRSRDKIVKNKQTKKIQRKRKASDQSQ